MADRRRTQQERREATRGALLAAGRELFGRRGYADVSAEEVVAAAGVTRGALYHHFEDGKAGLFAAVFEDVEAEFVARFPMDRFTGDDPLAAMDAAVDDFLAGSLDASVQRITLIDGPAVLGWDAWYAVEERHGLGLIRAALQAADEAGQLDDVPLDETAAVILGALVEGALLVSRARDQDLARTRVARSLRLLLRGLGTPGGGVGGEH